MALLLAGCSTGYRRAAPATATATATAGPAVTASPAGPASVDVDGDGRPDPVTIVEDGPRTSPAWRWGVRVALSSRGPRTLWSGCCAMDGQELGPAGDVDGDGRAEVSGSDGATATTRGWFLATLSGDRLVRVTGPALATGLGEGGREVSWSCVPGGIVMTSVVFQGTAGTRTYYRLDGTRLVRVRTVHDRWGGGVARPPEYGAFSC